MQKIGILGGMMDPIHLGHLNIAHAALNAGLDRVLLMPCKTPAHRAAPISSFAHRAAMCRLAIDDERILISEVENRDGPCYAADTVTLLKEQFPDAAFTWILGADKLPSLPHWRNAEKLFAACNFFVCPRPGSDETCTVPGADIRVLRVPALDISSAQAVSRIRAYDDALDLLPRAVSRYIALNSLYQPDFETLLRDRGMKPARLLHTLGVRETAVHLADRYGVSMQKAAVAAMLHDLAKPLSLDDMHALCREYGMTLPDEITADVNLLHGPIAAQMIVHQLGITDSEIVNAIACHTTGKIGMSTLEMIIFLADAIEPNRRDYPGLSDVRKLSLIDLRRAVYQSMRRTREYVISQGHHFFSQTEAAMQDLADQLKEVFPDG